MKETVLQLLIYLSLQTHSDSKIPKSRILPNMNNMCYHTTKGQKKYRYYVITMFICIEGCKLLKINFIGYE